MGFLKNWYRTLNAYGIGNFRTLDDTGEALFLKSYLSSIDKPVVVDVGANKGEYTQAVLDYNPSAQVFAFEPHPLFFAGLQAKYDQPNVSLQGYGLGDRDETVAFYDRADKKAGSAHASLYKDIIETIHHQTVVEHTVRIRRGDDVLSELEVDHIHLLKVDTEGHEMAVFDGMKAFLASGRVDAIQFEFNETNVIARTFFKDFWDLFQENYTLYRLMPDNAVEIAEYIPTFCEVFSFQNIVALKKPLKVWPNPIIMSRFA